MSRTQWLIEASAKVISVCATSRLEPTGTVDLVTTSGAVAAYAISRAVAYT